MGITPPLPGTPSDGQLPPMPDPPKGDPTVYRGDGTFFKASRAILTGRREDADGVYRFILGADDPNEVVELSEGGSEVSAVIDLTDADLISFNAEAVVPAVPAGASEAWVVSILIDGVLLARHDLAAEQTTDLSDLGAPVRRYTGEHEVTLRFWWQV